MRKRVVSGGAIAEGIPVRVTVTSCETGAVGLAVMVTVVDLPGVSVGGLNVALVPGGSPSSDSAMVKFPAPSWLDPKVILEDPPMGTPTSSTIGARKLKVV